MAFRSRRREAPIAAGQGSAVHGLDLGREHARRLQRRRRRRDRVVNMTMMAVLAGIAAGGAWFGYSVYTDHRTNEQVETDRRVAEFQRQQANQTIDDVIVELEESPAWNGPGNPTFGVGKP